MATGSLRAQLAYPAAATSATPDDDDALCAALGAVDLGHLAVELDATDDWTSRLSLADTSSATIVEHSSAAPGPRDGSSSAPSAAGRARAALADATRPS